MLFRVTCGLAEAVSLDEDRPQRWSEVPIVLGQKGNGERDE